ncbi:hypothetical protein N9270_01695 [Akkermansiaceae bacterium]|nr:hypothetical protein [Akkermansiaceae bacterium]
MKIPEHLEQEMAFRERALKMLDPMTTAEEKEKLESELRGKREHPNGIKKKIAALQRKSMEAIGKGDLRTAKVIRRQMDDAALDLLRRCTVFHHLDTPLNILDELKGVIDHCQGLIDALGGVEKPQKEDSFTMVMDEVYRFYCEFGRLPTRNDLIDRGVRGEDITNLPEELGLGGARSVVAKVKPGPKSS